MEERQNLEQTTRTRTAPYRAVQQTRLVLLAADGIANKAIAREVGLSRATAVMWRQRFAERCMLALLDIDLPAGYARWNRTLVAQQLGDISLTTSGGYSGGTVSTGKGAETGM